MNQIKFSHNWNNKLDGEIFTTIRKWTPEKEAYYHKNIEEDYDVMLLGKRYTRCILSDVIVKRYQDIDIHILRLDTGIFDTMEIFKIFSKFGLRDIAEKMIILTFRKVK